MAEQSVSSFFDSYAKDFDAIYGTRNTLVNKLINKCLRKSMRLRFEHVIKGSLPIEGHSVIDIGCGPGHFAITLAKNGAPLVFGLDFAEEMISVARHNAEEMGVSDKCKWQFGDFLTYEINDKYDYAIVCGFMDYMPDPEFVVRKVLSLVRNKAFFSFPLDGGFLAWQRKLRYRKRCELYMYTEQQVLELFRKITDKRVEIEPISRDLFVTVYM